MNMSRLCKIVLTLILIVPALTFDTWGRSLYELLTDRGPLHRVVYCTNHGSVLTREQLEKIDETFVKSLDIKTDTIVVTLKGYSISDIQKKLEPAYRADLRVGAMRCSYKNDEIPTYIPKTSQYMLSDSCFYLTFDLAPRYQTRGDKMAFSMFMVTDSLPRKGDNYPVSSVSTLTADSTIIEWHPDLGNVFAIQLTAMPGRLSDHTVQITPVDGGTVTVNNFAISRTGLASMKLDLNFRALIDNRPDTIEVRGTVDLRQIQPTTLRPCLFEIDHPWGGYLDNAY